MKRRSFLILLTAVLLSTSPQLPVSAEEGSELPVSVQEDIMALDEEEEDIQGSSEEGHELPKAEKESIQDQSHIAQASVKNTISTWQDLKSVIENTSGEATVTISGNLEKTSKDERITVPAGANITLVGDHVKIIRPSTSEVGEFYVDNGAKLVLQGNFDVEAKNYNTDKGTLAKANFIEVSEGGSLSIEGRLNAYTSDAFFNGRYGTKGFIYSKGSVTMKDASSVSGWTVYDTTSKAQNRNAAIVVDGANADFTMNGGEITGNYNIGSNGVAGAAVQVHGGASFIMNDGTIHGNGVLEDPSDNCIYGAGVFVNGENSSFKMTGGNIQENDGLKGAGVYIAGTKSAVASLKMTGGNIVDNDITNKGKYACDGGGIYAEYTDINIETLEGNENINISRNGVKEFGPDYSPMQSSGGGIYAKSCKLNLKNVNINDNTASGNNAQGGAGIGLKDSEGTIIGGNISGNQGGDKNLNVYGGGMQILGTGDVLVKDVNFENNKVSPNSDYEWNIGIGGAIMMWGDDTLTIDNCNIKNNHASGSGGGVYVNSGTVDIKGNTLIEGNTCNNNRAEWESYLGEGICITPDATVNLYDQARIDQSNTVGLEEYKGEFAVLTVADTCSAIDKDHPVVIESMNRVIEKLPDTKGTPLVKFLEAAGGEAAAENADRNQHFVASSYMPEGLNIGQSEENKDTLTYVENRDPVIHAEDQTLTVGEKFEPLKEVTATDKEDGDLTKEIEVLKNEVDTSKAGVYEVTYKVTDKQGASATKTIQVTVKEKEVTDPDDEQKPDNEGKPDKGDGNKDNVGKPGKSDTSRTDAKTPASDIPKTGDTANLGVWFILLTVSGILCASAVLILKKNRKKY